jgi:hypothetical protein
LQIQIKYKLGGNLDNISIDLNRIYIGNLKREALATACRRRPRPWLAVVAAPATPLAGCSPASAGDPVFVGDMQSVAATAPSIFIARQWRQRWSMLVAMEVVVVVRHRWPQGRFQKPWLATSRACTSTFVINAGAEARAISCDSRQPLAILMAMVVAAALQCMRHAALRIIWVAAMLHADILMT